MQQAKKISKVQSQHSYTEEFEKSKGSYTLVEDSVAMQQAKKVSKIQSELSYKEDFEKSKGAYTTVEDDVALKNAMKNTKLQSEHNYKEDFERSKGAYTFVEDAVALQQAKKNTQVQSEVKYKDDFEKNIKGKCMQVPDALSMQTALKTTKTLSENAYHYSEFEKPGVAKHTPVADSLEMKLHQRNKKNVSMVDYHKEIEQAKYKSKPGMDDDGVSYHADFEKLKGKKTSVVNDPETDRIRQNTAIQSNIQYQNIAAKKTDMEARRPEQVMDGRRGRINPGKISEYDPTIEPQPVSAPPEANFDMRNNSGVAYPQTGYQTAKVFDSQQGGDDIIESVPADGFQNGQRRQPGSISDYDPMTAYPQHYNPPQPAPPVFQGYTSSNINDRELFGDGMLPPPPPPAMDSGYGQQQPGRGSVHVPSYRAIYDYTAADDDEVSFSEGDLIIDCEVIDDGWMVGRVKRTGKHGMLPSNYVEKA
ncbi:nebulette isoform X11 [Patella vulgata]|nr:nebulette isoform X11 [Patella vulgata]